MSVDIRLPNINASTEREQLAQVKSYLFQLAEQLQWALKNVDASNSTTTIVTTTAKSQQPSSHTAPSAESTFGSIKALIIKSADIVNAYYEEINSRLSSEYVAQSDFGTFTEKTEQNISQTADGYEQLFTNIQKITTDTENLNFTLAEVNAHINSGKLYEDENGLPVYGLEIGQKNTIDGVEVFNKFARFISDRLSFFDQNGAEVAYISDFKLHITHAEVTGTLKLGGFLVDTTNGLAFKWVGRG